MNKEQNDQKKEPTEVTVGLVLGWGLGVLAAISGVTFLFSEPITGILMLLLAAVLLPPANKFVADKFNFSISGGMKVIVVIGLLVVIGISAPTDSQTDNFVDTDNNSAQTQENETSSNNGTENENNDSTSATQNQPTQTQTQNEPEPPSASFGNGTHVVGSDIEPGTYRSSRTGSCYWARLSGFSGELDDVIGNGNSSPEIVTISASDAAFETSGCGQWTLVENTLPATPQTSFGDGTYQVSGHIAPGTYRSNGSADDLCYWARLSSFSQAGTSNVITNGNSPTVIEISGSDIGFTTFGCGTWSQI